MVSTPWFEVPPKGYGGIESVCHVLAEGLTSRGHDVTLIGAGTDHDSAGFVPTFTEPADGLGTGESVTVEGLHALRATQIRQRDGARGRRARPLGARARVRRPPRRADGRHGARPHRREGGRPVPPVPAQRGSGRHLRLPAIEQPRTSRWVSTIHHGIDVEEIPFRDDKDDFLVFLGRMDPTKGPDVAIDVAREAGMRLVMAAKCSDPHEQAFFEEAIEPRLGPDVEWLGEADEDTKRDLLARARALLFPIDWEEPFGLVMIESMAAGTPVLAFRRGSVPEVVVRRRHRDDRRPPEELVDAIGRAADLDPHACRDHVRRRFSRETMIDRYESLFGELARRGTASEPLTAA